ncbi:hypothetical protein M427DRAFT_58615 [Gonapodya prolifera JEL478]|uniref:Uncharacterized protein n=1 Tax=Gonapodya prolifera (strain JEL478) TaxID=1344416 RepID=A0A139A9L7_GONPJ|nr:hypothetical protein M427DRAFT_58615 [Gonapodya prolifera JEL478]|eukprot:KXS13359.1 hypothetical protein M427DRAFT_58615 [Gonapodya prolifera JEL478]
MGKRAKQKQTPGIDEEWEADLPRWARIRDRRTSGRVIQEKHVGLDISPDGPRLPSPASDSSLAQAKPDQSTKQAETFPSRHTPVSPRLHHLGFCCCAFVLLLMGIAGVAIVFRVQLRDGLHATGDFVGGIASGLDGVFNGSGNKRMQDVPGLDQGMIGGTSPTSTSVVMSPTAISLTPSLSTSRVSA